MNKDRKLEMWPVRVDSAISKIRAENPSEGSDCFSMVSLEDGLTVDLEDGPAEWGWQDGLSFGGAGVLWAGLSVGAGAAQRSRLLVALT